MVPRQLALSTLTTVALLSLPAALLLLARAPIAEAANVERIFAGLGTSAAGLACVVSARATGRAFDAWAGAALLMSGVLVAATADLPLFGLAPTADGQPLQSLVVATVLGPLWVRTYRASEVEADLRPLRVIGLGVIGAVAGIAGVGLLARGGLVPALLGTDGARWVLAVGAAGWLTCVVHGAVAASRRSLPRWPAAVPAAASLAAVLRIAAQGFAGRELLAALLAALGAAVVLAGSGTELGYLLRFLDRQDLGLRLDLDGARREIEGHRAELHEQLHDLRNAVNALRCADATLRNRSARLDAASRAALADAMSLELARLQVLIEPGRQIEAIDFDLRAVLEPIVTAERNLGALITLSVDGVWAHGDPAALGQVVQNLLVNARRHAPGASVTIRADSDADRVALLVADDGPGIPLAERDRVFIRGERGAVGTGAAGDGLGLYVARRLVAASGGRLTLLGGPAPGARFLLELPPRAFSTAPRNLSGPAPSADPRPTSLAPTG